MMWRFRDLRGPHNKLTAWPGCAEADALDSQGLSLSTSRFILVSVKLRFCLLTHVPCNPQPRTSACR